MITSFPVAACLVALAVVLHCIGLGRDRRRPRYHVMRELDPGFWQVREALHGQYGTDEKEA